MSSLPPPSPAPSPSPQTAANPILIDLGRASRKSIRRLRRGQGVLMDEVTHAIEELRATNKISGTAQPIIVVVRQRADSLFDML